MPGGRPRRPGTRVETTEFQGQLYRRYPDDPNVANREYFGATIGGQKVLLHVAVWEAHYGPVPTGHAIHHRNDNTLDNSIDNLECMVRGAHTSMHRRRKVEEERLRNPRAPKEKLFTGRDWHKTPEGFAWHSQMSKRAWDKREPITLVCEECQCDFLSMSRRKTDRFCSKACAARWRYHAGLDNVERTCVGCGQVFSVHKQTTTKYCSRDCYYRALKKNP